MNDQCELSMSDEREPCGTHAAYVRHRATGEDACEPCKVANTRYYGRRRILAAMESVPGEGR